MDPQKATATSFYFISLEKHVNTDLGVGTVVESGSERTRFFLKRHSPFTQISSSWMQLAPMYFGLDNMSNVQPTTTLLCYPEIYLSSVPGYIGTLYRLHDSCIFVHLSTSHSTQKKSMQIIFTRGSYIHEMHTHLHTLQNKYTLSFCYL